MVKGTAADEEDDDDDDDENCSVFFCKDVLIFYVVEVSNKKDGQKDCVKWHNGRKTTPKNYSLKIFLQQ